MKNKDKRVSKDEYFLEIAEVVSQRATCPRLRAGAVLVKDGMVLSTGYNGAPRGLPHCDDVGCRMVGGHCVRTVHAEANAVLQAAYHGVETLGATLYALYFPCEYCTKSLLNAGIKRIVYRNVYKNMDISYIKEMLKEASAKVRHLPKK